MIQVTEAEMQAKIREAYVQGFSDGIKRGCEFYEISLRELTAAVSKKLLATLDTLFLPEKEQSDATN